MFWELFVIGGFWFWALTLVCGIWFLATAFHEKVLGAAGSIILYVLLLTFLGDFNVFGWLWSNPWTVLYWGGGYILAGVGWSVARWYLLNTKIKHCYKGIRSRFMSVNGLTDTIPTELATRWRDYVNSADWEMVSRYYDWKKPYTIRTIQDIIPKAADHKGSIIFWMAFWPLSVLFFVLHDAISELFERLYEVFSNVYGMISRKVFNKIEDEFGTSDG